MNQSEIKMINIEDLIPYINNPRHNDEAVGAVASSIAEFGFKVPIVVDKDMVIINGHTRLKAAKKLKLKQVPVIIADDLTPQQVKAFRLADNKVSEIATWDEDLLALELGQIDDIHMELFGFDMDLDIDSNKEPEEDNFEPEIPEEPKAKYGDIYKLGNHRLMCGDSTKEEDVKKLMNGELADLVVTDPPYNVDYSSKNDLLNKIGKGSCVQTDIKNDSMDNDNFKNFLIDAFKNLYIYMKDGCPFYIWHADVQGYNFRYACNEVGFRIRQVLIWVKNIFVLGRQDYQWKHEPCLYGWKDGDSHYFIDDRTQSNIFEDEIDLEKMKKEDMKKLLEQLLNDKENTTIIKENKPMKSDLHPTMKPIKLFGRLILNSSKKGENVLDVFGGSGTTIIACEQLGRNCFMMEFDPHYVDVIINRWEKFTGQKAELISEKEE